MRVVKNCRNGVTMNEVGGWERRFGREGLGEKAWERRLGKRKRKVEKRMGERRGEREKRERKLETGEKSKTVETKMYCTMQK